MRNRARKVRRQIRESNARERLQKSSDKGKENIKKVTGKAIKKVLG